MSNSKQEPATQAAQATYVSAGAPKSAEASGISCPKRKFSFLAVREITFVFRFTSVEAELRSAALVKSVKEASMFSPNRLFKIGFVLVAWIGCAAQDTTRPNLTGVLAHNKLGKIITVATFDPTKSQFPEGLAIDKEGNIYVGMYPTGQIWKITPKGEQFILATLDVGSHGGGMVGLAVDEEGDLYVCDASAEPATHGIWKVDRNGASRLFAALDPTGFPNAVAFNDAGNLFVTDSYLGEIWKVSRSGEAKVWFKDPLLAPLFAYGANGIEFDRGDMFVANTDQGTIVRIEMEGDDRPPHAEVFVQDAALAGADGLAFDVRHNLYVAVDTGNTLVRISPDRNIKTLATATDGLDFPASTSFGQTREQRTFLFWTNYGVNLKPSLQKLDVGVPGVPLP
jgi:sugar lactone lactonase YvrE